MTNTTTAAVRHALDRLRLRLALVDRAIAAVTAYQDAVAARLGSVEMPDQGDNT